MGFFDFLFKKNDSKKVAPKKADSQNKTKEIKCFECFKRLDESDCYKFNNNVYCKECYNRRRAVESQMGYEPPRQYEATERAKTFVCKHCQKELALKYRHVDKVCSECYEKIKSAKAEPSRSSSDFKMLIRNVFFLKDRGVVVDGSIILGEIKVNDMVTANGKSFLVRGIKLDNKLANCAFAGATNV